MTKTGAIKISVALFVLAIVGLVGLMAGFATNGVYGICEHEDSTGCVWVGQLQGNGQGGIVINGPER